MLRVGKDGASGLMQGSPWPADAKSNLQARHWIRGALLQGFSDEAVGLFHILELDLVAEAHPCVGFG